MQYLHSGPLVRCEMLGVHVRVGVGPIKSMNDGGAEDVPFDTLAQL